MNSAAIDVVGIGNAIVDVIAHADESFLAKQGFAKGSMTLIDADRAESLYAAMGPAIESSGGSAGNTMAGLASLGGAGAYIGKVRDDLLGAVFRHDITAIGVRFDTAAAIAHGAGRRVALSLSDPFCVARHRAAFRELVTGDVDILFANEAEICSLYETDDFAAAAAAVRGHVAVAALTRSGEGSVVFADGA